MRVLFLTETAPFPLDSGGRIKTWNVIRMLGREHEVHCHAFVRRPENLRVSGEIRKICAEATLHLIERSIWREAQYAARSAITRVPFVVERHFDRDVLDQIRLSCRKVAFDCVYCDHLSMIEYGRRLGLPIVYDAHNVEFEILRRHSSARGMSPVRLPIEIEWRRVRRYERFALSLSSLVFAVSEQDAAALRSLAPAPVDVTVVPISIDAGSIRPLNGLVSEAHLLFVGGLHWPPNKDAVAFFIGEIWPAIRRDVPDARLTVVGRADAHGPIAGQPGVDYAGYVEDVEPFFRASRVMVVPLRAGSGMRVKILDAFARGVPVVSTTIGCEGLDVTTGVHLSIADRPPEFARAVGDILRRDDLARTLQKNARQLVDNRYDSSVVEGSVREAMRRFQARIHPSVQSSLE